MRMLLLGDIVGRPGRDAVISSVPELRAELGLDLVVANAENASGGLGLQPAEAEALLDCGIDVLTTGNHIWKYREIQPYLDESRRVVRPANFPPGTPGRGLTVVQAADGTAVAVLNLQGRVFMEALDCPFRVADKQLATLPREVKVVLVDFHAEATSEKIALGLYLAGRVSAVVGTHTHVQTSDARLLRDASGRTTAWLTDLGMCGPQDSVLGMEPQAIVRRFVGALPTRFQVAGGPVVLEGAVVEIDAETGRATGIETFRKTVP